MQPDQCTRLTWAGGQGSATRRGVMVPLTCAPFPGWSEVKLSMDGDTCLQAQVRDRAGDPRRDMTAAEIAHVLRRLDYMAHCGLVSMGQIRPEGV